VFAASHLQCEVVLVRVFWLATCGSLNIATRILGCSDLALENVQLLLGA
jgi:hypothetical protein